MILSYDRYHQIYFKIKNKEINKINCNSCEFYSENLSKRNFIYFYKKFNSNIQLKASYDLRNLKKKLIIMLVLDHILFLVIYDER